jgi:hypothetical protein
MLKTLAGAALVGTLAALPAQAHDVKVYDANGQLVGPLVGFEVGDWTQDNPNYAAEFGPQQLATDAFSGLVIVNLPPYGPHLVKVARQGIVAEQLSFYFLHPADNCQSPGGFDYLPYIATFDLIPHARFDGLTLWALDTNQGADTTVRSRFDEVNGYGTCTVLPAGSTAFVALAHAVSVNFTPPFSVK